MKKLYWKLKEMVNIYFEYEIYKIYKPYTIMGIRGSIRLLKMYFKKEDIA